MELELKNLISLQECDTCLGEKLKKQEEGPLRINRLEGELTAVDSVLDEILNQLETSRRKRRQEEQGIEDLEIKIAKSHVKLGNIKNNKEYTAALKEIADLKAEKSIKEDAVLELMEKVEALEKEYEVIVAKKDEAKRIFEEESKKIREEMTLLGEDITRLRAERERLCRSVNGDLLKKYESIRNHREGLAISPVIQGVCQVCHMGIPPQKFRELIRCEQMMNCTNCGRIIYWGEDERFHNNDAVNHDSAGMSE